MQIILGSSSVARRKILAEMGYEFTIMVRLSLIDFVVVIVIRGCCLEVGVKLWFVR